MWYGHNRKGKHEKARKGSGGVGILVKNSLLNYFKIEVIDKSVDGIIGLRFEKKNTMFSFIVFACYLSPEGSPWADPDIFFGHLISQVYLFHSVNTVFICGDLNARIGKDLDFALFDDIPRRTVIDKVKNSHGDNLIDFLKEVKFCVTNGRVSPHLDNFTSPAKGAAVVDYILVPQDSLSYCSKCAVTLVSDIIDEYNLISLLSSSSKQPDHSVVSLEYKYLISKTEKTSEEETRHLNIFPNESPKTSVNNKKPMKTKKYNFGNIPDSFMNNPEWQQSLLKSIQKLENVKNIQSDIDSIYETLCNTLLTEVDKHFSFTNTNRETKRRFKYHKPYWNSELNTLWKDMKHAESEFIKCRGSNNLRNLLKATFHSKRQKFDKSLRQAERSYNRNLISELETSIFKNPTEFWNKIRSLGPRKPNLPNTVYVSDSNILTDNFEYVQEKWKNEFEKLYTKVDSEPSNDYINMTTHKSQLEAQQVNEDYNEVLNQEISEGEISSVIRGLKSKKASGLDGIQNELLKFDKCNSLLKILFNKCFDYGKMPSMWLKSIIVPIPKSSGKDPNVPLNYRGISLTSCISKVYSGVLNNRINTYTNLIGIIAEEQNGFRKGRSCEDHIYTLSSIIKNRQNLSKSTFACFIDMQKAFDWVDRNLLFYRLLLYNITGKMYKAIVAMYQNTQFCIKLNESFTDWFQVHNWVKQGDNLSPTLFGLFVNDLVRELNSTGHGIRVGTYKINALLYADDIVIIAETEKIMQELLDKVSLWCKKWQLAINQSKTKIMHFRKLRTKQSTVKFKIGSIELDYTEKYKYLGVTFDDMLTFKTATTELADAGNRALGSIIAKFRQYKQIGYKCFTKLFESGVIPVCTYGCGIWGYNKHWFNQKLQYRAMRYFLGVHNKTPTLALQAETGWLDMKYIHILSIIRLYNRLVLMPPDRLTRQAFEMNLSLENSDNWCSDLKQILTILNKQHKITHREPVSLEDAEKIFLEKMNEHYLEEIENKPKLRSFKLFKTKFETATYLIANLSRYQRSLLAKIRSGTLCLGIETGRFRSIPVENRLCEICKTSVEDEKHFLCECPLYRELRQTLLFDLDLSISSLSTEELFIKIMSTEKVYSLASFIEKAWYLRKSYLFNS